MRELIRKAAPVVLAMALAAVFPSGARAQWVRLQRCENALPCSVPFSVRYAPDPLLAAQYGKVSPTALSARVALEAKPTVQINRPAPSTDFAEEAARRFVLSHPPPAKPARNRLPSD